MITESCPQHLPTGFRDHGEGLTCAGGAGRRRGEAILAGPGASVMVWPG
jgi:hypothetical protein